MRAAAVVLALTTVTRVADAQIVVGPYTFTDETWFADTASMNVPEPFFLPLSVTTIEGAVVGFSPDSGIMNIGIGCKGEETVDVGFTDVLPFEGSGADVILFDAQYSVDDIVVRVRPVGGSFGAFHIYPAAEQTPTGVAGPGALSTVVGVNVDFADFGLPLGTVVDQVRVVGDCQLTPPVAEVDLVMAAVVDRSCGGDADCDDGDPCTIESCPGGTCSYEAAPVATPCAGGVCLGTWPPTCVSCLDNADCGGSTPLCDTTNVCVECLVAEDCEDDGEACTLQNCEGGACFFSTAPAGTPCGGGLCLGVGPSCVGCLTDADCTPGKPICAGEQSSCVECVQAGDCDDGNDCTADSCEQATCQHSDECPLPEAGGSAGAGGAGQAGSGGTGDVDPPAVPENGCECHAAARPSRSPWAVLWTGLALAAARRRWPSRMGSGSDSIR